MAFNFLGLIVTAMVWYEEQTTAANAIGLIFIVIGCMIYGIGMTISSTATKDRAKKAFWTINVWVLTFMPLSILYNFLSGGKGKAPYPVLVGSISKYVLFWIIYIVIGLVVNLLIQKINKNKF